MDSLHQLAQCYGIAPAYWSLTGQEVFASPETLQAVLQSMGVHEAENPEAALAHWEERQWRMLLEPVSVQGLDGLKQGNQAIGVPLTLPESWRHQTAHWRFETEQGAIHEGSFEVAGWAEQDRRCFSGQTFVRYHWILPVDVQGLDYGYHQLQVWSEAQAQKALQQIILTPAHCYVPLSLEQGARYWGPAVQLYSLRSTQDWGIGDFSALRKLVEWMGQQGASVVGVNPLHMLNWQYPEAASPYSPNSRQFENPLYIDVEAVPEFAEWLATNPPAWSEAVKAQLDTLRQKQNVPYQAVAEVKEAILQQLYGYFKQQHVQKLTPRGEAFRRFQKETFETLHPFAVFQALQAHFEGKGWMEWPKAYQDPQSREVREFERAHIDAVDYVAYLQWLVQEQLGKVAAQGRQMSLGLYWDLAVGAGRGGYDVWGNQELYALNMSIGAPPDPLAPDGQNWGLPPWDPQALRASGYQLLIQILRSNMTHAGALRLDHVAGLQRLYWIPEGNKATGERFTNADGAYVYYNLPEIFGIVALESHRNRCLIIGEDLGTVPESVKEAMAHWMMLSYKVARWERYWEEPGQPYKSPEAYPRHALVTFSTHDTSTLVGQFTGWLYRTWERLQKIGPEERDRLLGNKDSENQALLDKLKEQGLLAPEISLEELYSQLQQVPSESFKQVIEALHRFMARTPSDLVMFQFEDLFQLENQVNVPGTADAPVEVPHPQHAAYTNWRARLGIPVESFAQHQELKTVLALFRQERPAPSLAATAGVSESAAAKG